MRRIHPGAVGQRHQLVVERVVKVIGEFLAGETDRGKQVGPTDVADEQGVAGQHTVGIGVVGMLVDHDAHRLRGVPGGMAELQLNVAQGVALAVLDRHGVELGLCDRGVDDLGAGRFGKFEVAGEEVGMEVRLDDQLDGHAEFLGVGHVLADITLRIDDHGAAGGLVADQVRGVRQAFEVVLVELHGGVLQCLPIIPTGVS